MPLWSNRFSGGAGMGQWPQLVSALLAVLLVVAISERAARLTWLWWFPEQKVDAPTVPDGAVGQVGVGARNYANSLAGAFLFGKAGKKVQAPPPKIEVPETRLALELKGVVAGPGGKSGGAIIGSKAGERFFSVGATLPGDVVLDEVYAQRVLLLRNGRQETLKLVRKSLDDAPKAGGRKRFSPVEGQVTASVRHPPAGGTGGFLERNPGGINKALRVRPVVRGGKARGFRLSPGRNRKVFSRMGFRSGDLLTKINGVLPTDPKEVFSMLNQLQGGGSASVEVTRRGRPVALDVKVP